MPLEVVGRVCPCFVDPDLERTFLERYYHKCFKLHVGLLLGMLFIFGMTLREVKLTGMGIPAVMFEVWVCQLQTLGARIMVHILIGDLHDARRVGIASIVGTQSSSVLYVILHPVNPESIAQRPMALVSFSTLFSGAIIGTQGMPGKAKLRTMGFFFSLSCISLATFVPLWSYYAWYQLFALTVGLGVAHVHELSERSLFAISYALGERSEQLAAEKQRLEYEHSLLRHRAQSLERELSHHSDMMRESQAEVGSSASRRRMTASPQPRAPVPRRSPPRPPASSTSSRRSKAI